MALAPATLRAIVLTPALALAGCLPALDWLGVGSSVVESERLDPLAALQDDLLADKHPVYEHEFSVDAVINGCSVILNTSGSITKLDVTPLRGAAEPLDGVLFRDRAAALERAPAGVIPSIEVVNGTLKPFNDGLYAAIEVAVQDGTAGLPMGKRAWLAATVAALLAARAGASAGAGPLLADAAVHLGAALLAGGGVSGLPTDLEARASAEVAVFEHDAFHARPIGFYTWSPELAGIFRQDRLLQGDPGFGVHAAIASVLAGDATLRDAYAALLAVPRGLTDPLASYTPLDLLELVPDVAALEQVVALERRFATTHPKLAGCGYAYMAALPPSLAPDTVYMCEANVGPNGLLASLIAAVTRGEVSFAPDAGSGWYDYQLHALEVLLAPSTGFEADHLLLTAAYKKKLVNTFKSLLVQTRETHAKQLPGFMGTAGVLDPVDLHPPLAVEPLPTFYLRTARAYRFLGTFLTATLGPTFGAANGRLREDGTVAALPLRDELRHKTELLYGLFALTSRILGVRPETALLDGEVNALDLPTCVERARAWLEAWRDDDDVRRDPRVILPVAMLDDGSTLDWAVIGVRVISVSAAWVPGFEPAVLAAGCPTGPFVSHDYLYLVEDTVEVHRPAGRPPLTRGELRALCDEHQTRDAIVAALEE